MVPYHVKFYYYVEDFIYRCKYLLYYVILYRLVFYILERNYYVLYILLIYEKIDVKYIYKKKK